MPTKLHQHLISEPETRGAFEKIKSETVHVFKGKELFEGIKKEYLPKVEGGDPLEGVEKQVVTTVEKRLAWNEQKAIEWIDFEATREKTNTKASADLVVDGVTLGKALPATLLLAMEKRLREIREYYDTIPTLDLSKKWLESGEKGIFMHGPVEQFRTAKKTVPVVLYPATEKHPAQVKDVTEDVHVGTWRTTYFSGSAHPGTKAECLGRIDRLIEAVKKARMKANEQETEELQLGKQLFDFIHGRK